jgi:hypothetical protein
VLKPLLSEFDPANASEGSLDPVGLFSIADSLGVELAPGVRERQTHPRFLTALAVSTAVCSEFDDERIATDEVSEPWQVFEWYMVEGLVRTCEAVEIRGLPGREKASRALRDGVPLSAKRYLKNARAVGFHGVYRVLAEVLNIVSDGQIGERGYQLLAVWAKEQRLNGFYPWPGMDPGRAVRQRLMEAVADGLAKGATARSGGWDGWQFFRDHLIHSQCGRGEAEVIGSALRSSEAPLRQEVMEFLVSPPGIEALEQARDPKWGGAWNERPFHEALLPGASEPLQVQLRAIMAYETFSRLLQDAFDDCLVAMTRKGTRTSPAELAKEATVVEASERLADVFVEVSGLLEPLGKASQFHETFVALAARLDAVSWVEKLLEHHRTVQQRKPPEGKSPWFERFDDGSVCIRPLYRREQASRRDGSYVHAYRTGPLWSFARDLGMVES